MCEDSCGIERLRLANGIDSMQPLALEHNGARGRTARLRERAINLLQLHAKARDFDLFIGTPTEAIRAKRGAEPAQIARFVPPHTLFEHKFFARLLRVVVIAERDLVAAEPNLAHCALRNLDSALIAQAHEQAIVWQPERHDVGIGAWNRISRDAARAYEAVLHKANRGFCGTIEVVDKRIGRTQGKALGKRKRQRLAAKERGFELRQRAFFECAQPLQEPKQRGDSEENIAIFLGDERDGVKQRVGRNHDKSRAAKQGAKDVMHAQIKREVEKLRDSIALAKAIELADSRTIACEIGARDEDTFGHARAAACEEQIGGSLGCGLGTKTIWNVNFWRFYGWNLNKTMLRKAVL